MHIQSEEVGVGGLGERGTRIYLIYAHLDTAISRATFRHTPEKFSPTLDTHSNRISWIFLHLFTPRLCIVLRCALDRYRIYYAPM